MVNLLGPERVIISGEGLAASLREVFAESLNAGGTTFDSLYVNVNGQSGYFERSLAVYGRAGQPCRRCRNDRAEAVHSRPLCGQCDLRLASTRLR